MVSAVLTAAVAMLLGCKGPQKATLKDTEGRVFRAICQRDGHCELEQTAGPKLSEPPVLHSPGRLVGLCGRSSSSPILASCRPLVCSTEEDCPAAHGLDNGAWVGGLCVEPSQAVATADAVMLCLAGTGPKMNKPVQVERYAMALSCGTPCTIPRPCRQLSP